jgi:colanic acid biosynthesis glycosyl transferase WcaI
MTCIAVVSCVYPPEVVVSSRTSASIAEGLSMRGHEVTVIAPFPSRAGAVGAGESASTDGVRVVRCATLPTRSATMASRFAEYVSFGLTSAVALIRHPRRARVVYANTWPIFGAGFVALAARALGAPLVLSVQDVYPESLATQGRLAEDSLLFRLLGRVDGWIVRSAAAVVVITESFREIYVEKRGVASRCVHVVPNWAEADLPPVGEGDAASLRRGLGIPESAFVFAYGGNVGAASGLDDFISGFAGLSESDGAFLIVAGEGSELEACREKAAALAPERVKFLSPWRPEETSALLAAADVLVLPTRGRQAAASMPSKLITYMLAARPVLAVATAPSDLARAVQESGCGWLLPPDRLPDLPAELRRIRNLPAADLATMGRAGRAFALATFSREACLPRVLDLIEDAANAD